MNPFKFIKEIKEKRKWARSIKGKKFYSPFFERDMTVAYALKEKEWGFFVSENLGDDRLKRTMHASVPLSLFFDKDGNVRDEYKPRGE